MDIYVYTYPLPCVREVARANEDGSYTVLIAEHLSDEQKREAANHALNHVIRNDWECGDADAIESAAHIPLYKGEKAPISRFNITDEEIPILTKKTQI